MSDEKKAVFRVEKLYVPFRLVQAQKSFLNPAKTVGLRSTSSAIIPSTQTKIISYFYTKKVSNLNSTNCTRRVIHHQAMVAFVYPQAYTGNFEKSIYL